MDFHHAPKQAQKVIKTESPGADAVHGVSLETDRSICIERTAVINRLITVWDSRSSGWQLAGICGNLSRILTIVQLSVVSSGLIRVKKIKALRTQCHVREWFLNNGSWHW